MLILEGHSPAEFSSNPEKPWKKIPNCILKTLIICFRCVWLGLELSSAGTPALQDQRSPSLLYTVSCASVFILLRLHPRRRAVHMRTASLRCPRACFWCNPQYHGQSWRRRGSSEKPWRRQLNIKSLNHYLKLQKGVARSFQPGESVLLLLATPGSALKPKFSGPYTVLKKLSDTNYLICTPDRQRKSRLVHVNMIKSYVKDVCYS